MARQECVGCRGADGRGWNFRREHLRLAQRSHYVITDGGDQPNVGAAHRAVWYYFREADYDHIMDLWRIGDNMAKAANLMTDTTHTSRLLGSAWPGTFQQGDRRGDVRKH
jgi:aminobenzoyl-glutamate utilization protein B